MLTHDQILEHLTQVHRVPAKGIEPDTPLFSTGLVDSFVMVQLVSFIEKSCGFRMKVADMTLENLDSTGRIVSFLAGRTKG